MANKDDYLTEYRQFFEEFANTVEPNDQLPVKLGSYKFINSEVVGGIVDWCLQYLNRKSCPSTLIGPLTKLTIDEIRMACKKHPLSCGFNPNENVYEPLKLMQSVMSKMNEICLRYLDNSQLDNLPAPPTVAPPMVSMCATRNTRRRMEDRHIVIHDVNSMFNIQDSSPTSYYAIFDGHAGPDAASYSAAHLHQFLFESDFYPSQPEQALKEAFLRTDEFFLEKSKIENFRSGTTAVCALLRPKEETLYVAWVGDSQALLVNRGKVLQIVKPHKPCRQDEKDRIEANGGCVMFWGMWRVNGQLAVSRAIGDIKLKPYVTAEPDVVAVPLDGNEEFLIMACDGLWDFVSEDDAAIAVYNRIKANPENVEDIAEHLADIAKQEGSRDNISVIVIFLKDPSKIAKKLSTDWGWTAKETTADAAMDTSVDNTNNTANITANNTIDLFDVFQKPVAIPEFKSTNGTNDNNETDLYFFDKPTNGKRPADFDEEDEEEDDFGPETDVDAVDDVLLSPTIAAAKALVEGNMNKNCIDEVDKMDIVDVDVDMELQRQQSTDFESMRGCREETPTPPADSVLDSSGLADNVAESGEDSEDEWNYYRVDPKQKENNANSLETNTKVSSENPFDIETDEMSQLNPDAKEFVPVSPTRNNAVSPVPNFNRDVVNDTLVARSPRRAMPMDDNELPSPEEFCRGIKQRPSELFEEQQQQQSNDKDNIDIDIDIENQNQNQNGHQLSHQEIMQNLLNGKDPSEIEFHPSNYNNLICNDQIQPDSENKENEVVDEKEKETLEQQPETETEAVAETVTETDFSTFVPRSQDPMSMSFYQDKNEEESEFNTNPFDDLNKVQMLPDDIDDMPPAQTPTQMQTNDAHEDIENDVCELPKSPEVPQIDIKTEEPIVQEEPVPQVQDDDVCSLPKTPIDNIVSSPSPTPSPVPVNNVCELPQTQSPLLETSTSKSPLPPSDNVCELPKTPEQALNEIEVESNVCEIAKSPIHIDVDVDVQVCAAKSPMLGAPSPIELSSPAGPLSPKSPIPELTGLVSPDITASIKDENVSAEIEISETTKSPIINQTPLGVEDELEHEHEHEHEQEQEQEQEHKSPILQDTVATPEIKSPLPPQSDLANVNDIVAVSPKLDELVCEVNKEASDVQELITDAIQDIISAPEQVLSEEAKYLSEHITNIANEINEITDVAEKQSKELLEDEAQAKSPEVNNISIAESEVAPSDILNSFLDRSVIPEVTSPLSPPEKFEQERPESWKCEFPSPSQPQPYDINIKCETIEPEFPVHTIAAASPSEESKGNDTDTPPPTPSNVIEEPLLKLGSPEPQKIVEAVEKLTEPLPASPIPTPAPTTTVENTESVPIVAEVAAVAAAVAATATAVTKTASINKNKPSTTTTTSTTKKAPSKTSPTSPSKPLLSKTTSTTTTAKRTSTSTTSAPKAASTTAARLAATKPKTTTTPTPSPKPLARTTAAPKPKTPTTTSTASKLAADKKPLTNGDARAPIRQSLVKKTTSSTVAAKPTSKVSLTKTSTTTAKPLANGTAKPTATSATKTTTARAPLSSSAAPKPRPASLTSKSTTTTSAAKVAPIKSSSTTTTTKSPAAKPKTTTITSSAAAPRPRMILTAKTAPKTADTEKQIKETANKQISASRTSTTRTSATTTRTATTTLKKAAAPLTNRSTTTTQTRTTTIKSSATGKKPTEVTRTTITKTKNSPIKRNVEQNGVVNVIQEITTVSVVSDSNDDTQQLQLVKDNSPVDVILPIVDNSQLPPAPMEIIAD